MLSAFQIALVFMINFTLLLFHFDFILFYFKFIFSFQFSCFVPFYFVLFFCRLVFCSFILFFVSFLFFILIVLYFAFLNCVHRDIKLDIFFYNFVFNWFLFEVSRFVCEANLLASQAEARDSTPRQPLEYFLTISQSHSLALDYGA